MSIEFDSTIYFARFRMGGEHPMSQTMAPTVDVSGNVRTSPELHRDHSARSSGNKEREGLRASQSFDESVKI